MFHLHADLRLVPHRMRRTKDPQLDDVVGVAHLDSCSLDARDKGWIDADGVKLDGVVQVSLQPGSPHRPHLAAGHADSSRFGKLVGRDFREAGGDEVAGELWRDANQPQLRQVASVQLDQARGR